MYWDKLYKKNSNEKVKSLLNKKNKQRKIELNLQLNFIKQYLPINHVECISYHYYLICV